MFLAISVLDVQVCGYLRLFYHPIQKPLETIGIETHFAHNKTPGKTILKHTQCTTSSQKMGFTYHNIPVIDSRILVNRRENLVACKRCSCYW